MKLNHLALKYLWAERGHYLLQIILLALAVALLLLFFHLSTALVNNFRPNHGQKIDAVVGAKGSPLQLVLSTIYQTDVPNGNIQLAAAENLAKHPDLAMSLAIGLGDNYNGYRIVGTTPDFLQFYGLILKTGQIWQSVGPVAGQAVLGAEVATRNNLTIGSEFIGSHGLVAGGESHAEFPYHVIGILEKSNSINDRLIFTDLTTIWQIHRHAAEEHNLANNQAAKEITALLVKYKNLSASFSFPKYVNAHTPYLAASPSLEMARLWSVLGFGFGALQLLSGMVLLLAVLALLFYLWQSVKRHYFDFAIMRLMGAKPRHLFGLILWLSFWQLFLSIGLGYFLSRGMLGWLAQTNLLTGGFVFSVFGLTTTEIIFLLVFIVFLLLLSFLPAWRASRAHMLDLLKTKH